MANGQAAEVGTIGNEGVVGLKGRNLRPGERKSAGQMPAPG